MKWYSWLTAPYLQLVKQYSSSRAHHALLVQALPGSGVDTLITALGYWLMCQHSQGEKICSECHSCRLMKAGHHPDWHVLAAENGKSLLGVEQVRQLTEHIYAYSRQGGAKVVWLPAAETLSEAAANALLKTLEEPPDRTYFILGCRESGQLLATIRSRCSHYYLACPEEAYSVRWLERQTEGDHQAYCTALRLTGGGPLAAERLLTEEVWSQRMALCASLQQALSRWDWLVLLPELNQENVLERLHWLSSLLLDASKCVLGGGRCIANQDSQALITLVANSVPLSILQNIAQDCWRCHHELQSVAGLNRELILTERLFRWERWLAGNRVN